MASLRESVGFGESAGTPPVMNGSGDSALHGDYNHSSPAPYASAPPIHYDAGDSLNEEMIMEGDFTATTFPPSSAGPFSRAGTSSAMAIGSSHAAPQPAQHDGHMALSPPTTAGNASLTPAPPNSPHMNDYGHGYDPAADVALAQPYTAPTYFCAGFPRASTAPARRAPRAAGCISTKSILD